MAGIAGLEPANDGVKVRCLTDLAISQQHIYGVPTGIRTPDTRLRRPLLYPAELWAHFLVERVKGIEPSRSAWKAEVLPLNYTRMFKIKPQDISYHYFY
jgi:hypothetical protein